MQDRLTEEQLAQARIAFNGEHSEAMLSLIHRLQLGHSIQHTPADTIDLACRLGWVSRRPGGSLGFTDLGMLVADPVREYCFWIERGRRIHAEEIHPALAPENYRGMSVLEPGSGFGCNLFALSRVEGRFVGLEPQALYVQFTSIFAQRERIPCPEIYIGRAESMPFADGEFDVVICYASHHYMDLDQGLREMVRVLKPHGQLRIIGQTLPPFLRSSLIRLARRRSLGRLKYDGVTMINTVAYETLGKRIYVHRGVSSTTTRIFPSARFMRSRLQRLGLRIVPELTRPLGEHDCFVAEKIQPSVEASPLHP